MKNFTQFKIGKSRWLKRTVVLVVCVVVGAVGTAMLLYSRAEAFCDINPSNDNPSIQQAINGCADGTTIRFPVGASYSLPDTIYVKDRNNLVIDGRGSTFTITTQGNTKPISPVSGSTNGGNWLVLRGTNITLKNIKAVGSFPLGAKPGVPRNGERSLSRENDPGVVEGYAEYMSNFGIYGTVGVYLEDLEGWSPWGDMIVSAPDQYVDGSTPDFARSIYIKRVKSHSPSRHCWALTSGSDQWIEDSYCGDAWYVGTDEETDTGTDPATGATLYQDLVGVHLLRNTFEGIHLGGILFPVPGPNVRDIEIRGNVFLTAADVPCNTIIVIGGYPNNPETFKNVIVENNTILTYGGRGIGFDHVEGGSIKNNKITTISEAGCGTAAGPAPMIEVTSSTNVVQENNGPNAPGADGTTTTPPPSPTPPPPTPTPTPSPSPTPTPTPTPTPPPSSACVAPTNLAGTAGPSGSGRYDFTWTAASGATAYNLYYAVVPNQPSVKYTGPFTTTSASAFGLAATTQYNFAVRATCSGGESTNSNVVTTTGSSPTNTLAGDINRDGKVNFDDALAVIRKWNTADSDTDLNKDGTVNFDDALQIIRNWSN